MAVIILEGNVRIMTFHPPVDFDPLTVSAAELSRPGRMSTSSGAVSARVRTAQGQSLC
jgi:hypothetical protein